MSYETNIRPLFREDDREAMDFVFDLWTYDDVKTNANLILERLADGTMPCDEPWPDSDVETFRIWVADGCPP